jgi:hypothetical protein
MELAASRREGEPDEITLAVEGAMARVTKPIRLTVTFSMTTTFSGVAFAPRQSSRSHGRS